jgi:hypothetical protein
MPRRMILPIAFIIVTLFFVIKGFFGMFQDEQAKEEQRKAEFIEKTQEKREYDLKLQGCIEQQNEYHDSLEAEGKLYSIENGKKVDNSFKLLSAECKMMIIRSEKESDNESAKQEMNTTEVSS